MHLIVFVSFALFGLFGDVKSQDKYLSDIMYTLDENNPQKTYICRLKPNSTLSIHLTCAEEYVELSAALWPLYSGMGDNTNQTEAQRKGDLYVMDYRVDCKNDLLFKLPHILMTCKDPKLFKICRKSKSGYFKLAVNLSLPYVPVKVDINVDKDYRLENTLAYAIHIIVGFLPFCALLYLCWMFCDKILGDKLYIVLCTILLVFAMHFIVVRSKDLSKRYASGKV